MEGEIMVMIVCAVESGRVKRERSACSGGPGLCSRAWNRYANGINDIL
jgi:hypothetical protein